jgi:hypothetical protein
MTGSIPQRSRVTTVGPVVLLNGRLTGDTTPHTQVCLP